MDIIFNALGEPKRRDILELLAAGEQSAGTVLDAMQARGPISQPAVSQHLKVLREAGLVEMRAESNRRIYAINRAGVDAAQAWLASISDPIQAFAQPLEALETEIARGKRSRRSTPKAGQQQKRRPA